MRSSPRGIRLGPRARRAIRFVARFVNPLTLLVAGRRGMPIVGVLHHVGRRSGRTYSTPLGMRPDGSGFVMPLTFSESAAWYRNVRAAGSARATYRGRTYDLIAPEVVDFAAASPAFPRYERIQFRALGIDQYLRMRVAHAPIAPAGTKEIR